MMPIEASRSRYSAYDNRRETPGARGTALMAAMLSDTVDLTVYPKAMRVYNASAADIILRVTLEHEPDDTSAGAVPLTVPAGVLSIEPLSVRRIWSTGSTGLAAGLVAGTVQVLLITE